MRPTRLKFEYAELRFPSSCPNCMTSPADVPVRVSRDSGALAVWMDWPHCSRCAEDEIWKRRRHGLLMFNLIVSISVTIVSGLIYFQGGILPVLWCLGLSLGGALLGVAGIVFFLRSGARRSRPEGAVRLGAGVSIVRGGTTLQGKNFLSLVLYNEAYVAEFRKANRL